MSYVSNPKVIILGIDALEYNLVEEWCLKNIMQKSYCKMDLSDYSIVVTPPIWGSMLTGKIDQEIINYWDRHLKMLWWTKIGNIIPASLNLWFYDKIFRHLIKDPFKETGDYVLEKKESNVFQFFKNTWTNGIPGYGYKKKVRDQAEKKLLEKAIIGEKSRFRKRVLEKYELDKLQLFSALDRQEYDMIFWYTPILDQFGHIDMSKPVTLMMKYYLEINNLVGIIKDRCSESNIYVISDHGMEPFKLGWGMHSNHAFFSSNTGETINKPFKLYELLLKYKNK